MLCCSGRARWAHLSANGVVLRGVWAHSLGAGVCFHAGGLALALPMRQHELRCDLHAVLLRLLGSRVAHGDFRPEVLLAPGGGCLGAVGAACGVLAPQALRAGAGVAAGAPVVRPGPLQRHALCARAPTTIQAFVIAVDKGTGLASVNCSGKGPALRAAALDTGQTCSDEDSTDDRMRQRQEMSH